MAQHARLGCPLPGAGHRAHATSGGDAHGRCTGGARALCRQPYPAVAAARTAAPRDGHALADQPPALVGHARGSSAVRAGRGGLRDGGNRRQWCWHVRHTDALVHGQVGGRHSRAARPLRQAPRPVELHVARRVAHELQKTFFPVVNTLFRRGVAVAVSFTLHKMVIAWCTRVARGGGGGGGGGDGGDFSVDGCGGESPPYS